MSADTSAATAPASGGAGAPAEADEVAVDDGYRVSAAAQVDLKTMLEKDKDDESLQRYKATLLGTAVAAAADAETRRVVVHEMRIAVEGRPDIVMPLNSAAAIAAIESTPLLVKEGCSYVTKIIFSVHRDVVVGLKFDNVVSNTIGITLDRVSQMIGSYPPDGKR